MAQSLVQIYVHLVFSTKDRIAFLHDKGIRSELYAYIIGILINYNAKLLAINGTSDHVHILFMQPKSIDLVTVVRELKRSSSQWLKEKFACMSLFAWQAGYAAFSICNANVDTVIRYIKNQEMHHRTLTFQNELIDFLRQQNINYDERYLWN